MNRTIYQQLKICFFPLSLFFLGGAFFVSAQSNKRLVNGYPLSVPSDKRYDLELELKQTMTAMIGGVRILASGLSAAEKGNKDAFSKSDYLAMLEAMAAYADEIAIKIEKSSGVATCLKDKKQVVKALKGGKYDLARSALQTCGGIDEKDSERIFFIWKHYMEDKNLELPWLSIGNTKVTRVYRALLEHVGTRYEKPFGPFAEQGAILADAMQALSNSLENPGALAWQGEGKFSLLKAEDELKRLASSVVYYEWKLHDPSNGLHTANINREQVHLLQRALYDVVRSMVERKSDWDKDPSHGKNLIKLYEVILAHGWKVNGNKADSQK